MAAPDRLPTHDDLNDAHGGAAAAAGKHRHSGIRISFIADRLRGGTFSKVRAVIRRLRRSAFASRP